MVVEEETNVDTKVAIASDDTATTLTGGPRDFDDEDESFEENKKSSKQDFDRLYSDFTLNKNRKSELGKGGFGQVHKATDLKTNKTRSITLINSSST